MTLIGFVITIACIAALCWVVRDYIALPAPVKMIFYVLALIVCVYLLISIAGIDLGSLRVGRGQ